MAEPTPDNQFNFTPSIGDREPHGPVGERTGPNDFAQDGAGVPNVDKGEKTNMDMALEPNKFPRETGHDSLTGDEVIYS